MLDAQHYWLRLYVARFIALFVILAYWLAVVFAIGLAIVLVSRGAQMLA